MRKWTICVVVTVIFGVLCLTGCAGAGQRYSATDGDASLAGESENNAIEEIKDDVQRLPSNSNKANDDMANQTAPEGKDLSLSEQTEQPGETHNEDGESSGGGELGVSGNSGANTPDLSLGDDQVTPQEEQLTIPHGARQINSPSISGTGVDSSKAEGESDNPPASNVKGDSQNASPQNKDQAKLKLKFRPRAKVHQNEGKEDDTVDN